MSDEYRKKPSGSSNMQRNRSSSQARKQPEGKTPLTEEQRIRRQQRLEQRRREVRRNRIILGAVLAIIFFVILFAGISSKKGKSQDSKALENKASQAAEQVQNESKASDSKLDANDGQLSGSTKKIDANNTSNEAFDNKDMKKPESLIDKKLDEAMEFDENTDVQGEVENEASGEENEPEERVINPHWNPFDASTIDRSNFAVNPEIPCGSNEMVPGEKVVYLTIDDGPTDLTPEFLDVLDAYNVKATFFVSAQQPQNLWLVKEEFDRGHTIGLHSYTHDYDSIYSSAEAYFEDLNLIGQAVAEQIGFVPCFIRFPGGSACDTNNSLMQYLTEEVQNRGYQYYDWNQSSADGGTEQDPGLLFAAATNDPEDTILLLMHDTTYKEPSLKALPAIIEFYLSEGYEFRPITRDSFTAHQILYY